MAAQTRNADKCTFIWVWPFSPLAYLLPGHPMLSTLSTISKSEKILQKQWTQTHSGFILAGPFYLNVWTFGFMVSILFFLRKIHPFFEFRFFSISAPNSVRKMRHKCSIQTIFSPSGLTPGTRSTPWGIWRYLQVLGVQETRRGAWHERHLAPEEHEVWPHPKGIWSTLRCQQCRSGKSPAASQDRDRGKTVQRRLWRQRRTPTRLT